MTFDGDGLFEEALRTLRGLAIDMVEEAKSGHPGLPLGAAPAALLLWQRHLRHHPRHPDWPNRDRFVLSAGHGSALLYGLLHLFGYDLSLEDLRAFRQWGSRTPGHPERGITPGVEMATGPLGQGIATAVGMALAERFLAATFNRPGYPLFDHFTYVLASDGDLMEGVAQEACSLAGHLGLGKLIVLYDDNRVTIDGPTSRAFTEDTAAKFAAMGWQVLRAEFERVDDLDERLRDAQNDPERPTLIVCPSVIGYGSPNKAGTAACHGSPLGTEEARATKVALGLDPDRPFDVPERVSALAKGALARGEALRRDWEVLFERYRQEFPREGAQLEHALSGGGDWSEVEDTRFERAISTRKASHGVIQAMARAFPTFLGGSADLASSVFTDIEGGGLQSRDRPAGRNIAFGVREHAMAAMVNGLTLHGGCRAFGGTFLVFSDYARPALRLAALMHVPSIFVFSHDSIGLGEDGPTHQPVEHLPSLRAIPGLYVLRPADAHETIACWRVAWERKDGPSALVLSRQDLPLVTPPPTGGEHPALRGGYVLREAEDVPRAQIVATGSEVGLALGAAERLAGEGVAVRVVSLPCWELFSAQPAPYRESTLRADLPTVAVEAASPLGWERWANLTIGVDRFGASAPGPVVLREYGFTEERIVEAVRSVLARPPSR